MKKNSIVIYNDSKSGVDLKVRLEEGCSFETFVLPNRIKNVMIRA